MPETIVTDVRQRKTKTYRLVNQPGLINITHYTDILVIVIDIGT